MLKKLAKYLYLRLLVLPVFSPATFLLYCFYLYSSTLTGEIEIQVFDTSQSGSCDVFHQNTYVRIEAYSFSLNQPTGPIQSINHNVRDRGWGNLPPPP